MCVATGTMICTVICTVICTTTVPRPQSGRRK
jgi:hypothetical protein